MKLYISHVQELVENKRINDDLMEIVTIFLEAVNDWPKPVLTFEDYESEIQKFLNATANEINIKKNLQKVDFTNWAWQAESITKILEIYKFYSTNLSLKEIIDDLSFKMSKQINALDN